MPEFAWPDAQHRTLIGTRVTRVDSPAKVSGQAKYTYDVHRPGMLYGKVLRCPYPHAKVVSVDTSAAEKIPGVKAVHIVQGPGANIHWAGDDIVAVAAVDERVAEDAIRAIKVAYQQLPYLVSDAEPPRARRKSRVRSAWMTSTTCSTTRCPVSRWSIKSSSTGSRRNPRKTYSRCSSPMARRTQCSTPSAPQPFTPERARRRNPIIKKQLRRL